MASLQSQLDIVFYAFLQVSHPEDAMTVWAPSAPLFCELAVLFNLVLSCTVNYAQHIIQCTSITVSCLQHDSHCLAKQPKIPVVKASYCTSSPFTSGHSRQRPLLLPALLFMPSKTKIYKPAAPSSFNVSNGCVHRQKMQKAKYSSNAESNMELWNYCKCAY